MREELDLRYTFGEMTDAELLAFEDSLTGSARSEAVQMRTTVSDLKRMNDSIPEPQISFERVRHAIEAAPAAKPAPIWQRWLVLAAPVSALAVMAILMNRGGGPAVVAESVTESTAPSIASTVVPEAAPEISPKPADWETINKPVVVAATPPPVSQAQTRPIRRYVARLDDGFRRSSASLTKSAPITVSDPPVAIRGGVGGSTASEAADGSTMAVPASVASAVQESVVVVTSTPNSETGANSAVEVSKQSDVVLGG